MRRTHVLPGIDSSPGPILEGHNGQPTVREFQARMQELRELEQRDASRCAGSPVGNEAITQPSSRFKYRIRFELAIS
jgi:hypothetical protein